MSKLIFGAFSDREEANKAIMELEEAGVPSDDFSIIGREGKVEDSESSSEKIAAGGAAVGGTVGGLAGLIGGSVATAGMFIAGPIALLAGLGWVGFTTLTGGVAGAVVGGLVGALVSLGVPEEIAQQQEAVVSAGGILVGVEDNELSEQEVREGLGKYGAERITVIEHSILPARMIAASLS